jgi:hypothetical protein
VGRAEQGVVVARGGEDGDGEKHDGGGLRELVRWNEVSATLGNSNGQAVTRGGGSQGRERRVVASLRTVML